VKWCRKCAESVTWCRTDKCSVYFWIQPVKCLKLAAQQVDCSRYEVLGRQSFGRHISCLFWEWPAVLSVQNASDYGQCTLTSTHSTTRGGSTGEANMALLWVLWPYMALAIALFAPRIVYITASTKLPMGCIQLTEINCHSQAHTNHSCSGRKWKFNTEWYSAFPWLHLKDGKLNCYRRQMEPDIPRVLAEFVGLNDIRRKTFRFANFNA